jgi:hypothetical protein
MPHVLLKTMRLLRLVLGIGVVVAARTGTHGGVAIVVVAAATDAAAFVDDAFFVAVDDAVSLLFSRSNLATCTAFAFARVARTMMWQPPSMHALHIGSTTEYGP